MSYNNIDPNNWTYFYDGMTYQDLGLDPNFNDKYEDDYPDDYLNEDSSSNDCNIEDDKDCEHSTNKNEIEEEPKQQKVKTSEKSRLVTKELSTCQSNKQIRNKSIKILLNMHIKDCVFYYAKSEYLP